MCMFFYEFCSWMFLHDDDSVMLIMGDVIVGSSLFLVVDLFRGQRVVDFWDDMGGCAWYNSSNQTNASSWIFFYSCNLIGADS